MDSKILGYNGKNKNIIIGIISKKNFSEKIKFFLSIFFIDKFGKRKALKLLDRILNLPVNCWGIEYVATAIGPIKILIKYLSSKLYDCCNKLLVVIHLLFFLKL